MNYTKPDDNEHEDSPSDWLAGALVFSRALGLLLENGEGICIKSTAETKEYFNDDLLIVSNDGDKISVLPASELIEDTSDLKEGQFFQITSDNE